MKATDFDVIKIFKLLVIETDPCLRRFGHEQKNEQVEKRRRNHVVIATLS